MQKGRGFLARFNMIRASQNIVPEDRLTQSGAYCVHLSSVGNPDFGQDPARPLYGVQSKVVKAVSIADASEKCRKFLDENGLGSGNWSGGQVYLEEECVAVISYNGRAWEPCPDETQNIAISKEIALAAVARPTGAPKLVAVLTGSVATGFGIAQIVDIEVEREWADTTLYAKVSTAEFVEIKSPKELDKKQDHPLESDSVFVGFSSGYGSGLELHGPFPADGIDAENFGEAHRADGAEWEIWAVQPQAEEVDRPRPST